MSQQLSELEQIALKNLVAERGYRWTGLEKWLAQETETYEQACASAMRTVPRNHEQAADYAAKAEATRYLLAKLESFAREI